MENDEQYVKIKLNSSKANRAKGFYLLMTNGNTHSYQKDEFIVKRKYLEVLKRNNVVFEMLPSEGI